MVDNEFIANKPDNKNFVIHSSYLRTDIQRGR